MKKALIFRGGWDGHQPVQVSERFARLLRNEGFQVDIYDDPGAGKLLEIAKSGEYAYIICSVLEMGMFGTNTAKLCGPVARNMMSGWMRFKTPVLFISYYNPYFGKTYETSVDTIINSYGFTKYTADAIVDKIVK